MSDDARKIDLDVEIPVPADQVWKALTDATELTRWFPPDARVTPGPGGAIFISWGGAWSSDLKIDAWEEGRRLRLVEERPSFGADGQQTERPPVLLWLEYELSTAGGGASTRLRLVHSGFGHGADWDDEVEATRAGWVFELRSLRHYLTRHPGTPRQLAWATRTTDVPPGEAWTRLTGGLLTSSLAAARPGDRYESRTVFGEALSGEVLGHRPGELYATVEPLHDGLFRMGAERLGGRTLVQAGFSLWGLGRGVGDRLRAETQGVVDELFPG